MLGYFLIMVLSFVGAVETVYLIRKRIASEHPVCIIGQGCGAVLDSKYNRLFIVHNDVLGLMAYAAVLVLSILLLANAGPIDILRTLLFWLAGISATMSVVFTFIQWQIIRAWCFWCLMSAIITWVTEAVVVFLLLR